MQSETSPATVDPELTRLLEGVRAGSSEDFLALREKYAPMLGALEGQFSSGACEADIAEITQEAEDALYRAALTYQSGKSAGFGWYAHVCVSNALVSRYRKWKRNRPVCSLEEIDDMVLAGVPDPSTHMIAEESAALMYREIDARLSGYEKQVFDLYVEGYTPKQIAASLGKTEKSVSNAICRTVTKLRPVFGHS